MPRNLNHARMALAIAVASSIGLASCMLGYVQLCKLVTHTGGAPAVILAAGILILLNPGRWATPSLALLASSTLVTVVKVLVGAERPPMEEWLVGAEGPSFPSGHAAATASLWAMLVYEYRNRAVAAAGLAHTLAVAASRITLRVHYIHDVIAGVLAGAVFTISLVPVARRSPYTLLAFTGALSILLIAADPRYRTPWLLLAASIALGMVVALASSGKNMRKG